MITEVCTMPKSIWGEPKEFPITSGVVNAESDQSTPEATVIKGVQTAFEYSVAGWFKSFSQSDEVNSFTSHSSFIGSSLGEDEHN